MFGPDKLLGQLSKLDRYGNMATVGDFNPLSANIPATKVEVSVSCSIIPLVGYCAEVYHAVENFVPFQRWLLMKKEYWAK
uniref:Uncharacterized protein n=1 Tax=Sphaerodactylus townsendi TaxID=933632 RepID=A0ACB8FQR2_9SAUR